MRNRLGLASYIIMVIVALTNFVTMPHAQQIVLHLTDAYYQGGGAKKPYYLIPQPRERISLQLVEEFRIWIDLKTADGKTSPCLRGNKEPCAALLTIVGEGMNGKSKEWKIWETDARIEKDISFSLPGRVPTDILLGEAEIHFKIVKGKEELFFFKVPIEIR